MSDNNPSTVHEARQQQAQMLLKIGDLALQEQDARGAAQRAGAHADALAAEVAAMRLHIVRLEGWIAGAEAVVAGDEDTGAPAMPANGTEAP